MRRSPPDGSANGASPGREPFIEQRKRRARLIEALLLEQSGPYGDVAVPEDEGWHKAQARYSAFLKERRYADVAYLELGVGLNTLVIIKYPFWQYAFESPCATYASVNLGQAFCPPGIASRSLCPTAI